MQHQSALHQYVHERLVEAFGPPNNSLGRDDHWAVKPTPIAPAVNILVNGTAEVPAIWVFDPYSTNDGALRIGIERHEQVEEIIKKIQERLRNAQLGLDGHR